MKISDPLVMSNGGEMNMEQFVQEGTVKLINSAGIVLKCTIMTRIKALLIYHHFRQCVDDFEYDPYTVAAACLNLSIKYNEEKMELEKIILLFYSLIDQENKQSTQSEHFNKTLKTINMVEMLLLRMLEFDLNHVIAHQYLPYFMYDVQDELSTSNVWDVFAETCMRLASDFYLSNKCMIYKADEIAIAVVQVSLYMIGCSFDQYCFFKLRLETLSKHPESKVQSIIEDIFSISFIGSHVKSRNIGLQ